MTRIEKLEKTRDNTKRWGIALIVVMGLLGAGVGYEHVRSNQIVTDVTVLKRGSACLEEREPECRQGFEKAVLTITHKQACFLQFAAGEFPPSCRRIAKDFPNQLQEAAPKNAIPAPLRQVNTPQEKDAALTSPPSPPDQSPGSQSPPTDQPPPPHGNPPSGDQTPPAEDPASTVASPSTPAPPSASSAPPSLAPSPPVSEESPSSQPPVVGIETPALPGVKVCVGKLATVNC